MTAFYVVKLLDDRGFYRADTFILADVELRSPKSDLPEETKAIEKSITQSGAQINQSLNCRIGTIINASSLKEAELLADERFVKALDVISSDLPLSNINLTNCGYIKNLTSGELTAIEYKPFMPNMSFIMPRESFPIYEFKQWVAVQNSDLALRYRRSLHWSRNGKWENNLQIRILFNWFAVEALFKESEDDNVGPLIRWFLGYPNGERAKYISPVLLSNLKSNSLYMTWKSKIEKAIEAMRLFRNDSVHRGFRSVDFSASEVRMFNQIISLGCSRCQDAVVSALIAGLQSVQEFREYISLVLESNVNLVNDVHNNILFSLAHGHYEVLNKNIYG
jgi:hypothetical protein